MKNIVQATFEYATPQSLNYYIKSAYLVGYIVSKYEDKINSWHDLYPASELSVERAGITLHSPERDVLMAFIKHFGGDYEKHVNSYERDKMDYVQQHKIITGPNDYDYETYCIMAASVEPPAACKIVEEEVIVPEQKKMVRKIVCPSSNE